jgi:hypothetical protein
VELQSSCPNLATWLKSVVPLLQHNLVSQAKPGQKLDGTDFAFEGLRNENTSVDLPT